MGEQRRLMISEFFKLHHDLGVVQSEAALTAILREMLRLNQELGHSPNQGIIRLELESRQVWEHDSQVVRELARDYWRWLKAGSDWKEPVYDR